MITRGNIREKVERVTVLGAGESGVGAALLAKAQGYQVFVSDGGTIKPAFAKAIQQNNIPYEEGSHDYQKIEDADIIIKSPGIPDHIEMIQRLLQEGKYILSEMEFAYLHDQSVITAVTGSNGKTTVLKMLEHLAQQADLDHTAGGNVGVSYAGQVANGSKQYRMLEVSSFQLDQCYTFAPHIAILTNITPDHLDRYQNSLRLYAQSKIKIATAQTVDDYFIYNADNELIQEMIDNHEIASRMVPFSLSRKLDYGAFIDNDHINIQLDNTHLTIPMKDLSVKGQHNTANAMAASTAAQLLRIRKETIRQSMFSFKGIEHRLEPVLRINKVQYINDSKATNINATYYALDSMEKPTVWIVGGVDKGNDYTQLYGLVNEHVKAIVCLGVDNVKLIEAFSGCVDQMVETSSMEDAVRVAYKLANAGDNVLLSPACASFDLFENYEHRGRQFKEAVRRL